MEPAQETAKTLITEGNALPKAPFTKTQKRPVPAGRRSAVNEALKKLRRNFKDVEGVHCAGRTPLVSSLCDVRF
eukprot:1488686-Rhodomonas_salina.2